MSQKKPAPHRKPSDDVPTAVQVPQQSRDDTSDASECDKAKALRQHQPML